MTHFFQPLDLTVNGSGKQFMKKEFVTYYSDAVKQQLESGTKLEDVRSPFLPFCNQTTPCPMVGKLVQLFFDRERKTSHV